MWRVEYGLSIVIFMAFLNGDVDLFLSCYVLTLFLRPFMTLPKTVDCLPSTMASNLSISTS